MSTPQQRNPPKGTARSFAVKLVISLGIGAGFVYLAFKGLKPGDLLRALGQADYRWVLPFFATLFGVQFFRAWRWRFLLQPVTDAPPGMWRLLVISSVGFGAIILLPLRLGEFVRPILIADPDAPAPGERLRASAALGTIAVERVVDGLLVSLFLFVAFLAMSARPASPTWMMPTAMTALAIFGGATLFLVVGLTRTDFAVRLFLRLSLLSLLSRRLGGRTKRLHDRLDDSLRSLIRGFGALKSAGALARFLAASLAYWIFNGLGFYVLARAFDLDLELLDAYAVCGMVAIGIVLPAGPGLVGNFHEFGKFGLQLSLPATVIRAEGMAFIMLIHGLQFIWYVGLGLAALRSRHVRFHRVLRATVDGERALAENDAADEQ